MGDYGYSVEVAEGYEEAITRTRLALRGEGFSILTEMHVGDALGPRVGPDRQYLIMGAWNSSITRAIASDARVQMHVSCNFVVQETGSSAIVAALDPAEDDDGTPTVPLEVADDARAALGRVLQRVATLS
ncbi:MAG TPA: DUF302 domain-containing protein [Actinomycetota bacterium]|nr:DUF302 domain-containing protein [Actinomycetota bacterium]